MRILKLLLCLSFLTSMGAFAGDQLNCDKLEKRLQKLESKGKKGRRYQRVADKVAACRSGNTSRAAWKESWKGGGKANATCEALKAKLASAEAGSKKHSRISKRLAKKGCQ